MTKHYNHDIEQRATSNEQRATSNEQRATSNERVAVYVATHKRIDFSLPNYCKKIQVNAEKLGQWDGYLHDNDGTENISSKNASYCELTALYSMWKNCNAEIQGLFHYRRFFSEKERTRDKNDWQIVIPKEEDAEKIIISQEKIIQELKDADIILGAPFFSDVINIFERFRVHIYMKDFRAMLDVIEKFYPDYLPALRRVLNGYYISQGNMFIARRDFVNNYCEWLFDVLAKIEERISLEGYDADHTRTFGYYGEFLLNVYVLRQNLKYKYFQRARVVPESFLRRTLRKIPFVMKIFWKLRDKKFRNFNELEKFLKTRPSSYEVKNFLRSIGAVERENFLCFITKIKDGYNNAMSAIIFPENELANLNDAIKGLEIEAARENLTLMPRIIISAGTSESEKKSLLNSGVCIMEY